MNERNPVTRLTTSRGPLRRLPHNKTRRVALGSRARSSRRRDRRGGRTGARAGTAARARRGARGAAERQGLSPEGTFRKDVCGSLIQQSPEDQARAEREHAAPVGRGADGAVGARAEPAPARALGRGGDAAQAAAPHAQEPRLRGQLPREARVPEGGAAEAEVGAGARGGQAGARERRHAPGARRAARQVRGPAGLRALRRRVPRARRARGARQRHHHRQVVSEPGPGPGPRPRPRPRRLLLVLAAPGHAPLSKPLPSDPSSLPKVPTHNLCPQVPFLCSPSPCGSRRFSPWSLSSLCGP